MKVFRYKKGYFELQKKNIVMGIVNVTPDSFSDGGLFLESDNAVRHARKLISDGADIIDLGAMSTRPGSEPVFYCCLQYYQIAGLHQVAIQHKPEL